MKSLGSDAGAKKEDAPRLTVIGRSSRSPLSELLYLRLGSVGSAFRSRSSSRSEHPRKLADALPQGLKRRVDRCPFPFNVGEAPALHLLDSRFEAFAAYGIHRKEGECLRERYSIRSGMQKFNVRIHFPKNGTQSHLAERFLGDRSFNKQSRSPGQ